MTHYIELKHFHLYISHNKLEVETIERFIVSSWNITVHMLWHSPWSGIWDFHQRQELLAAFVWMTRWKSSCDRLRDHRRRRLWDLLQGATGRQLRCRKDNGKEPEVESRRTGSSKGNYHRITGWEPAKTDLVEKCSNQAESANAEMGAKCPNQEPWWCESNMQQKQNMNIHELSYFRPRKLMTMALPS